MVGRLTPGRVGCGIGRVDGSVVGRSRLGFLLGSVPGLGRVDGCGLGLVAGSGVGRVNDWLGRDAVGFWIFELVIGLRLENELERLLDEPRPPLLMPTPPPPRAST